MAESTPLRHLIWSFGVPFYFCLAAGQLGGVVGAVLFAILITVIALLTFVVFATGAPLRQGSWALALLAGGIAGFISGSILPKFMTP